MLGVEYGWLFATGDESKRLFKVFRESLREAVALGCDMLMSAPGPVGGPIKDAIEYLNDAGDIAAEYGLRLAIEFNSQHEVLNKLSVLRELLDGAGKPNCGYLIDAYHFTRSGAGGRGFEDVPAERIFCFQYSDLSPNPVTGVKRPTDRLPPGKGVVKWREMLGLLAEKNYTGYLSYEAPNPDQWARSPYDVAREGVGTHAPIAAGRGPRLCQLRCTMAGTRTSDFSRLERQIHHRNPADGREAALHDKCRAQGGQSRQMDRAAAHADPDRRARRHRMQRQNPQHRRLRQAPSRSEFSSGL